MWKDRKLKIAKAGEGMHGLEPNLSNLEDIAKSSGWCDEWFDNANKHKEKQQTEATTFSAVFLLLCLLFVLCLSLVVLP